MFTKTVVVVTINKTLFFGCELFEPLHGSIAWICTPLCDGIQYLSKLGGTTVDAPSLGEDRNYE